MNRHKRYSAQQAANVIRQWICDDEDTSSEEGIGIEFDEDNDVDSEDNNLERPLVNSQSSDEDAVEENDETDSDFSVNNDNSDRTTTDNGSACEYVAKSGRAWKKQPPSSSGTTAVNVLKQAAGPTADVPDITSAASAFRAFFDDEIYDIILKHSNEEGRRLSKDWQEITRRDLDAFLGILLLCGVYNMSKVSVRLIWSSTVSHSPIYKAAMSRNRFYNILTVIRFDDKSTRVQRREVDKFAPIRELFDRFTHNCRRMWYPSECVTVDEQLLGFRGRCPFRQYLPSKPDKYGIKLWLCADPSSCYTHNLQPILDKDESRDKDVSVGTHVVMQLTAELYGSGRNITCDNFFTNVKLADELYKKKLTILGTMRQNLRDVPSEFRPNKGRDVGSSLFGFDENKTIVSYMTKRNKAVVLLSTMHRDDALNAQNNKPDIIIDYNNTKYGVDVVDQLCHKYSTKRATRRWPLCVFYGLLDIAGINAMVVFCNVVQGHIRTTRQSRRRLFLEELAMQLLREQLQYRSQNPDGLHASVRCALQSLGFACKSTEKPPHQICTRQADKKRKRCHLCAHSRDRKVFTRCASCANAVCPEHSTTTTTVLCDSCS